MKRSSNIDTSKVTNPQFKQALESIASSLDNMVTPLPEEAVGVGARWEVRQGLAASGTSMFQKAVFEVVSIDGKVVTLKVTGEQTAPPQAMSNPAFPPGTEASLQKATGAISGTMTMRLDDLVPTSVLNSQLDMIMDVSIGGQSQTMSVTTAQTIEVSPAKAGK